MKLRDWRKREGFSLRVVAEAVEVSIASVSLWERGLRMPYPWAMRAIYDLTAGKVTPNDFYDLPAASLAAPENAEAA